MFARDFPEILEDSARVGRAEEPQSELYRSTARIFSELVSLEPALRDSQLISYMAARLAKLEIAAEEAASRQLAPGELDQIGLQAAALLDLRLGPAWRDYQIEMRRLSPVARGEGRAIDDLVNHLEVLYWAARCCSFSQASVPAAETRQ
jgi:hypothetical protein